MNKLYAAINDEIVYLDTASIPLLDNNYAYGVGVYETLRVRGGKLFFPDLHMQRLFHSADIIGLAYELKAQDVLGRIQRVILKNNLDNANIKLLLIKSGSTSVNSYIYPIPISHTSTNLEYPPDEGVEAMLYRGERHFPGAKSLSMLLSSVALGKAQDEGCWDALLVDRDGYLREGSRSNLFWIRDSELFSAPEADILSGVTRYNLIKTLNKLGIKCVSGHLHEEDLISDPPAMFLTSTSIAVQHISTVVTIDGSRLDVPENPLIKRISQAYLGFLAEYALGL